MSFSTNEIMEGKVMRFSIIVFWLLYWLFNIIDKFIGGSAFLWVGKDRHAQFIKYFSSIGIENPAVPWGFLVFTTIIQIIIFVLIVVALVYFFSKNDQKAHRFFFLGTLGGFFMFTFFGIGDQIFGDRAELWEHTSYWVAIMISWIAYIYFSGVKTKEQNV